MDHRERQHAGTASAVAAELQLAPSSVSVYKKRIQERLRQEIRRRSDVLD
jgi:DNA-binding CsgD family transcriptional regulator